MRKAIILAILASGFFIIFIVSDFTKHSDKRLHIVFCDVGQGDAIFITTPKQAQILVDGGPDKKVLECLSGNMPFWDRSLDIVIMTHPDGDHSGGLVDVLKRYKVTNFYTQKALGTTPMYNLLKGVLAEKKLSAKYLQTGNRVLESSGFSLEALWPSEEAVEIMDQTKTNNSLNELSVVLLLSYGDLQVLLTGDAGFEVMEKIAGQAGDIEILKVPHHGSATGMSSNFLSLIRPELAVVSVGAKNLYGHPAKKSLELLEERKIEIFRTDHKGEIEIESDGKIWSVEED